MMKFPYVSLETYDKHTQILINAQGSLIQQNEWLRDQYEALLEKYHALKLQGAAPIGPDLPVRQPLSTDLADEEAAMGESAKPVEVGPFRDED